MACGITEKDQG